MVTDTFVQSVKVVTGRGSLQRIGELLEKAGYQKAFLVFYNFLVLLWLPAMFRG